MDAGRLTYEYNLFLIERTRVETKAALPTGRVKIEVESRLTGAFGGPMAVTLRIDGKEVARGTVPRTAKLAFTGNDAFDVGMDSYSPVSEAYHARAPFKFNGTIDRLTVKYLT